MNDNLNKEVKKLKPFTRFIYTIGELPSSYLFSMTYEEQLIWLCNYLATTVIPTVNNNGEAVEELQNLYIELKEYVDNYLENLDIQEEINNKLDEMAESGQLADIIAQYLQVASVLGFDTKSDLKAGTNFANGSIARTIGTDSYNDGKGNYYKIRTLTSSDVIDDNNILALSNYPTLIAEKLPDYRMNQVEYSINTLNNVTIPNIEQEISELSVKKWLFIGDSYSQGYTPDGNVTSWSRLLKIKMNLDNDHCIIADHGGSGFANPSYPYSQILNDLEADNDITDILIAGGYNDLVFPENDINTGMNTCKTLINSKFPNAKVHIGFIGGTSGENHGYILRTIKSYQKGCLSLDFNYMPNLQYILFDSRLFSSDGIHPNQDGENAICDGLFQALNGGYNYYNDITLTVEPAGHFVNNTPFNLRLRQVNNTSNLANGTYFALTSDEAFSVGNGEPIRIGTIQRYGIIGSRSYDAYFDFGNIVVQSNSNPGGFWTMTGQLFIQTNGAVWIRFNRKTNDTHNGYLTFGGLIGLQIDNFSINYLTDTL